MPKQPKIKRLRDSYRFPNFSPALTVTGVFGDPRARLIQLTRRSKKRSAVYVKRLNAVGTIAARDAPATFPVAAFGFTLDGMAAVSIAEHAWT